MNQRVLGFDLARAYAIFGMFIVNFSFCFGTFGGGSFLEKFQFLFIGNASSVFIILAGLGLTLMVRNQDSTSEQKAKIKKVVLKRSWFLFGVGLLLYSWWPGDILHFYGGYLHIAAYILFIPKKYYLWLILAVVVIYHLLLLIIPVSTGWNYVTSEYLDFWTPIGFLRNTLYNGWNSILPWISFFFLGMWLGRLNWNEKKVKRNLFLVAIVSLVAFKGLKIAASYNKFSENVNFYMKQEYSPIVLPFMIITASCAILVILLSIYISEKFQSLKIIKYLTATGKMSLTLYVFHITIGMIVLSRLTGKSYTGLYSTGVPASAEFIMTYVIVIYTFCVFFCVQWSKKFKKGPLEMLMRKISD